MVQVPSPEVEEGIHASCSGSSASQRAECKGAGVTWLFLIVLKLQDFKSSRPIWIFPLKLCSLLVVLIPDIFLVVIAVAVVVVLFFHTSGFDATD